MNKRLVLVVSSFPQGSETFIVSKFTGLLLQGYDVHIVCSQFNRESWAHFSQLSENLGARERIHQTWPVQPRWIAPILLLPALLYCLVRTPQAISRYFRLGWKRFGWQVFKRFYLDFLLIILKPTILHFEFGSLVVGRAYLKEFLKCKLSVSFRGYDLNYIGLDQPGYYDQVWERIDGAHFLGEDLWRRAQRRGAPPELKNVKIPPAVDCSQFPPTISHRTGKLGTHHQPLRILSVGRLHWKKGYEFSLQAVKKLVDSGMVCEYQVIGDGDYQDALYYARHQLGLEDVVTFYGGLPHEKVVEKLQWADLFLHAAVSEGFCNAVLEAQTMGVPVVCSDADGLRENIKNGMTGFVVPRRDPAALAEKLALLAADGDLRRKMGEAGRKRIVTHFRMDQQLDAFEDFYEQL